MRNNGLKRLLAWMLVLLCVVGLALPMASAAVAEERNPEISGLYLPDSMNVYLKTPANLWLEYEGASLKDITKLKSSNTSVAAVKKYAEPDNPNSLYLRIVPKKVGKATISFNLKYQKKTYKIKTKITVKKYVNPFKSFKIGTESFEKYLDTALHTSAINAHVPLKKKLSKQKLNFKLKDGWTLQEVFMYHNGEFVSIKNKQKITVKKGDEIDFRLQDPKGDKLWFYFFFD